MSTISRAPWQGNGPGAVRFFTDLTAPIGSNGDGNIVTVTTGGTSLIVANQAGRAGIRSLSTAASGTGRAILGSTQTAFTLGFGPFSLLTALRLPLLSTGADRFLTYVGLFDSDSATPTNGLFLLYSDNVNGGRWQLNLAIGGVTQVVDTGLAAVANNWLSLRVGASRVGAALVSLADVTAGTLAVVNVAGLVGLPSVPLTAGVNQRKTAGLNARVADVDYFGWEYSLSRI